MKHWNVNVINETQKGITNRIEFKYAAAPPKPLFSNRHLYTASSLNCIAASGIPTEIQLDRNFLDYRRLIASNSGSHAVKAAHIHGTMALIAIAFPPKLCRTLCIH